MDKVVLVAVSLGAFKAQPLKTVCARSVSTAPTSYSVIRASIKLLLKEPILRQKNAPNAFPGSGKMEGHKGRHITVAKRKYNVGEPCPYCSKESGKLAGHRGRHVTVRQFIYEEDLSNDENSQEINSKGRAAADGGGNKFSDVDEHRTKTHLDISEKSLPKYERDRLANIKRNDAYLASLGLGGKSLFRTKVSQAGSSRKKQKSVQKFSNLPPRILPKRRRVEPKYFKDEQAREANAFREFSDSDVSSEDLSSEVEDEDRVVRADKDEDWHDEYSDDSDDKSWSPGAEKSSIMQNEVEIKVVGTEPKKRKRGRPKKVLERARQRRKRF